MTTPWSALNDGERVDRLMDVMGRLITALPELGDDGIAELLGRLHGIEASTLMEWLAEVAAEKAP